jgi:CRP-like cAMP-binding protein
MNLMSTAALHDISMPQNLLLAALTAMAWERVKKSLRPIFMPLGEVLYEPGMNISHLCFPTTSVIAISCVLADGRADAVTLIGREGFAGVEVLLGNDSAPRRATVLSQGWGYRIERELLNRECGRGGSMRSVLLRYTQSYLTQVAQTSVCNRYHSIDQQLCRWLLMFLDRQTSNDLTLTQEQIAELMGVRRESVTEAARKLQIAGSIRYQRGHISVVDRMDLETRSCECYEIATREADRLLAMSHRSGKLASVKAAANGSAASVQRRPPMHRKTMPTGEISCFTPSPSY